MKHFNELIIEKPLEVTTDISTIPQMVFGYLPHREAEGQVIAGHLGRQIVRISLEELRSIILFLQPFFEERGIQKGHTVLLLSLPGSSEVMTALYFLALACQGVRVFMPMQCHAGELRGWIKATGITHAILPAQEVRDMDGHLLEKNDLAQIEQVLQEQEVQILDSVMQFPLYHILLQGAYHHWEHRNQHSFAPDVLPTDEALVISTSGSTGRSKLVVYRQEAYPLCCMAWEQAGLYKDGMMGGAAFTPLVAHTMGVRGLMNALWTGKPACLINPDLFFTDPAQAVSILVELDPKVIIGGPGVFKVFRDILQMDPALKQKVLGKDKILVNCGAKLDRDLERELGHIIWNAFGTTETQLVLTNMFDHHPHRGDLGQPLPGVSVRLLEKYPDSDLYDLQIRSRFGCSRILDETVTDEYIRTEDEVYLLHGKNLLYAGRSKPDFIKDDFGMKVPLMKLYGYYHDIIERSLHTEWFTLNGYPGSCALVFTDEQGECNEQYRQCMDTANVQMMEQEDPLSFAHWHLARIGIIHHLPPLSGKGTIAAGRIREEWADFIELLRHREQESTDVVTSFTEQPQDLHTNA